MGRRIYVVGSLRNPEIPEVGNTLRAAGHEAFDDWYGAGPNADDHWREYEEERGRAYREALKAPAAEAIFNLDMKWLEWADTAVLVLPAGRSAHMEAGWMVGKGRELHILMPEEHGRWDVMYRMAKGIHASVRDLLTALAPVQKVTTWKIAVLAGTYQQFLGWCREKGVSRNDQNVIYAGHPDVLRGQLIDVVHIVGTFWHRPDAFAIHQESIYARDRRFQTMYDRMLVEYPSSHPSS